MNQKRPIIRSKFKKRILKELRKNGPLDLHQLAEIIFGKRYTSKDTRKLSTACSSLKIQGYVDNPNRRLISFGFEQANWGSVWELIE